MTFLTGRAEAEYLALLADLREGRLVRAVVAVSSEPTTERTLALVPSAPPEPEPLPDEVIEACQTYGRSQKARNANFATARQMRANGVAPDDIALAIAQGHLA